MIAPQDFTARIEAALAAARERARVRLAAELPPDVTVVATADGLVLAGRALGARALFDQRLRDLAGWLR